MADNSSQIVEDIKWFMFDDESKEIKNDNLNDSDNIFF